MENFIGTAILTVLSALAYIAYRHPIEFKTVGAGIQIVVGIGFLLILVWSTAIFAAQRQLIVADLRTGAVEGVLDTLSPFSYPWLLLMLFGFNIYIGVLLKLPDFLNLGEGDDDKKKDDKE